MLNIVVLLFIYLDCPLLNYNIASCSWEQKNNFIYKQYSMLWLLNTYCNRYSCIYICKFTIIKTTVMYGSCHSVVLFRNKNSNELRSRGFYDIKNTLTHLIMDRFSDMMKEIQNCLHFQHNRHIRMFHTVNFSGCKSNVVSLLCMGLCR